MGDSSDPGPKYRDSHEPGVPYEDVLEDSGADALEAKSRGALLGRASAAPPSSTATAAEAPINIYIGTN